jgi:pyruvate-formate lyase-activating enzyme
MSRPNRSIACFLRSLGSQVRVICVLLPTFTKDEKSVTSVARLVPSNLATNTNLKVLIDPLKTVQLDIPFRIVAS